MPRISVEGSAAIRSATNNALVFAGLAISFYPHHAERVIEEELAVAAQGHDYVVGHRTVDGSHAAGRPVRIFFANIGAIQQLATGLMMLSLGYIGLLKSAVEMFENHWVNRLRAASSD